MKKIMIVIMSFQLCSFVSLAASNEQEKNFDFVDASFLESSGMNLGDTLSNYIASVKQSVQQEPLFVKKSIILAQGKAGINDLVDVDQIDLVIARGEFDLMLLGEQKSIQTWQNYCESIIGRTRSDIMQINDLPQIAKDQFNMVCTIYNTIKSLENRNFTSLATVLQQFNYESLNFFVRQALDTALQQGLGIQDIDNVMHRYRYHYIF